MTERVLNYDRTIVTQDTGFWCGPASTQNVLNSRGINVSEPDLAREIGTHQGGTDHIGLIVPVLNRYLDGGYVGVLMPNDPPAGEQCERLWSDIVRSIDAGFGVVANIVAPPRNYPRAVPPSTVSPAYGGGTVFHYVALMGYSDDGPRRVWVADSGFRPFGYWVGFDQLCSLIPPKGYAAKPVGDVPPREASTMTAEILSLAMGGAVGMDRYRALLPAFLGAMRQAQCTNMARATMWCAQLGHESVGLRHMREIADGSQYEGRGDLGNTQPGDGVRFAGRGPIQVTGRHNYTQLSRWAHAQGYVPTATFFVDNPRELESDKYGFLGAVWYWTVARPGINAMCDAGDINGVTKAINGGLNGLDDRKTRWNRCKQIGAALLPGDQEDDDVSLLDERFENYKGNKDLTYRDWFWWADKNIAELKEQAGPWPQTAGLSNTDALAAIGEHLGLPGFALPADHPYKQAHPEFGKKES